MFKFEMKVLISKIGVFFSILYLYKAELVVHSLPTLKAYTSRVLSFWCRSPMFIFLDPSSQLTPQMLTGLN